MEASPSKPVAPRSNAKGKGPKPLAAKPSGAIKRPSVAVVPVAELPLPPQKKVCVASSNSIAASSSHVVVPSAPAPKVLLVRSKAAPPCDCVGPPPSRFPRFASSSDSECDHPAIEERGEAEASCIPAKAMPVVAVNPQPSEPEHAATPTAQEPIAFA